MFGTYKKRLFDLVERVDDLEGRLNRSESRLATAIATLHGTPFSTGTEAVARRAERSTQDLDDRVVALGRKLDAVLEHLNLRSHRVPATPQKYVVTPKATDA